MNSKTNGISKRHDPEVDKGKTKDEDNGIIEKPSESKYKPVYAFASKHANKIWYVLVAVVAVYLLVNLFVNFRWADEPTGWSKITHAIGHTSQFVIVVLLFAIALDRLLSHREEKEAKVIEKRDAEWDDALKKQGINYERPPRK